MIILKLSSRVLGCSVDSVLVDWFEHLTTAWPSAVGCLPTGTVFNAKFSLSYFIWTGFVLYALEKRVVTSSVTWYRRLNLCCISVIFGIEVLQVLRRNLCNHNQFNDSLWCGSRTAPKGVDGTWPCFLNISSNLVNVRYRYPQNFL